MILIFLFEKDHEVDMSFWPAGEEEALKRLDNYLDKKIFDYAKNRNEPILEGTSRLSPYLASGILSPNRCILEALKKNDFKLDSGEKGLLNGLMRLFGENFIKI